MMLIDNKKQRIRIEVRLTEKQKEQIDRAANRCGVTQSEYLRQKVLGTEPKAVLPDAFFVCCEKLDRLTRLPYSKEVNAAALAVLMEMSNILTGKAAVPVVNENKMSEAKEDSHSAPTDPLPPTLKNKRRLFGRR